MRRLALLLPLLAAPALADTPAYAPGAPADAAAYAFAQHPGAQAPIDAPLTAEDGTPTTLRRLAAGRPILLVLNYFRCPNLCGTVREAVFATLEHADLSPSDYLLAAVTIDPAETPADAHAAHEAAVAPANAAFLTGDAAGLEQAVGFPTRWMADAKQFLHPAGLVVLTPSGTVASYVLGVGYAPADLRRAITQAASGVVAAKANPILLLCFHYDPVTGRYSLAITRVLQLAAALTTLTIGGTLYLAHRGGPRA